MTNQSGLKVAAILPLMTMPIAGNRPNILTVKGLERFAPWKKPTGQKPPVRISNVMRQQNPNEARQQNGLTPTQQNALLTQKNGLTPTQQNALLTQQNGLTPEQQTVTPPTGLKEKQLLAGVAQTISRQTPVDRSNFSKKNPEKEIRPFLEVQIKKSDVNRQEKTGGIKDTVFTSHPFIGPKECPITFTNSQFTDLLKKSSTVIYNREGRAEWITPINM